MAEQELAVGARREVLPSATPEVAGRTPFERIRWFVVRQPLGAIGAVIISVLVATAIFAPQLAPHGPKDAAFAPYVAPGAEFLMGTDHLGRDVLSRVIWGARLSLYVGLVSVLFGITLGTLWGVSTAYFGGLADTVSQRMVDCLMALPPIILALSLMAALGQSVNNVILALTILLVPTAARTLRSVALSIREMPFVEAAWAAGSSDWRIIFRHVLPNTFATYIVLVTVNIAYAIVVEAALSFLGLGAPPGRALLGYHAHGRDPGDGDRALDDLLPRRRHQRHRPRPEPAGRRDPRHHRSPASGRPRVSPGPRLRPH